MSDVVGDYKPILPLLSGAKINRVNLEFAYPGTGDVGDLALLPANLSVGMGVVDVRTELGALRVQKSSTLLVGERQMGGPAHREGASLSAEDDEFESEAIARRDVAQVTGVVPPLGQPVMRGVVGRKRDRLRIGPADSGCRCCRR